MILHQGDAIHVRTPGGGGFGAPGTREAELIKRDLLRGYYDVETLKDRFSVSINEDESISRAASQTGR